jgi:hypothetical protein
MRHGLSILLWHGVANACPTAPLDVTTDDQPATNTPCMQQVDFSRARSTLGLGYSIGATGTTQTGVGQAASGFAALDLTSGLQFGSDPEQPSYELEAHGGVAVQQSAGAVTATGLITRAGLRLGPAQIAPSVLDEGRGNLAFFPLTMELAHVGELGARPRFSARPELARARYGRERLELATRVVRVEGAGEKPQETGAGTIEPQHASSWNIDVLPLHAGADITMQDSTRLETTVGGAMMGVGWHTMGMHADLLAIQHRRIDHVMVGVKNLDTVWMLKIDGVDPITGTQYTIGWGELIVSDDLKELARWVDPEESTLSIGGVGWFSRRSWGGYGLQYKREPYVSMQGDIGLEDRVFGELSVPRALNLVARTFAARATRVVDGNVQYDSTAGLELDASYVRGGWITKVGVEVGRTFYTALDNALPGSAGFAAAVELTLQHTGGRTWTR